MRRKSSKTLSYVATEFQAFSSFQDYTLVYKATLFCHTLYFCFASKGENTTDRQTDKQSYCTSMYAANYAGFSAKFRHVVVVFSGMINLKSSKTNKNKFERNQVDEFVVEAVDIGELRKIKYVTQQSL